MQGQMMHRPLRIIDILLHAAEEHTAEGIVSARVEGDLHRQTYPQTLARAAQLAQALTALGLEQGDRIGTLAWNGHRHFELYYGVSGIGAVIAAPVDAAGPVDIDTVTGAQEARDAT